MAQAESHSSVSSLAAQDEEIKTLTRADLAEALHRRTGFARGDAARYVEMVLEEIFDAITSRDDVKLSSFGAFQIRAKRERQGRNPKTGEGAKITARLVVTFRPSNVLRARVNNKAADAERREGDGALKGDGQATGGQAIGATAAGSRAYGSRRGDELHSDGATR
ncbi:integration host factor subunit alpha [Methylocystis sp. IM3]|jgi:integration host factor subunit alpha|uniref:integration host factor subunit alpha n=1 Tax=unclassified Methylocystis TaxID=2625913 RepID=UPI000F934472|nr:MAG: integration host factor subunit alpha [Hyphomicrobiales bacterium]